MSPSPQRPISFQDEIHSSSVAGQMFYCLWVTGNPWFPAQVSLPHIPPTLLSLPHHFCKVRCWHRAHEKNARAKATIHMGREAEVSFPNYYSNLGFLARVLSSSIYLKKELIFINVFLSARIRDCFILPQLFLRSRSELGCLNVRRIK